MSHSESHVALVFGGDNPHAAAWIKTLENCPSISCIQLCGDWPKDLVGDKKIVELDDVAKGIVPDFALVCTTNYEAPSLAEISIDAGIPTIVEKPVARNSAEIEKLNDSAKISGSIWATGFLNRYHPSVIQLKKWIKSGAIGRVLSIEGRMVTSDVQARNPSHWLFDEERAGGGILHWLGIHTIDLIRYLTNMEFSKVCGQIATSVQEIDVEEIATASFSMHGGAIGTIHAGYVLPKRYGDIALTIRGTMGDVTWKSWDYHGRQDHVYLQSSHSKWNEKDYHKLHCPTPDGPGYGGQMGIDFVEDFIRANRSREQFVTDGHDAVKAMQFVEAVYRSAKLGQTEVLQF